jgi:hypothetical protein
MTQRLVPCAGCGRHVKADDAACPFCGGAPIEPHARSLPSARLGRAATFAFGAALAAATTGCSGSHRPSDDGGTEQEDAGPVRPDAAIAPPYGAPPDDGGIAPLYGGAPGD